MTALLLHFILLFSLIGAFLTASYSYSSASPALAAGIPREETAVEITLQERASQIALGYGIATTTLHNLLKSESNWKPDADNGEDRGIAQISRTFHPEVTDEQAFDPEFGMRFAAQTIKEGREWSEYVVCNCYLLAKTRFPNIPRMSEILPNSTPTVGGIVIFYYGKVKHVAIIEKFFANGFTVLETNFKPCLTDTRFVDWNDPAIHGYAIY